MALATTTDLEGLGFDRTRFGKSAGDWPGFAAPYLARASRQVKGSVGTTAYADAELPAPTDPDRAADLTLAEAYLACSHLAAFWAGRLGAQLGSFSAANSSVTASTDSVKGMNDVADGMMSHCNGILRQYAALTQTGYVGYEPPEDE